MNILNRLPKTTSGQNPGFLLGVREAILWWTGSIIPTKGIVNNCHGSGEKLHNVLLWGLAGYTSARKGGLEGSIHYPSCKMPNLTYSDLILPIEWLTIATRQ